MSTIFNQFINITPPGIDVMDLAQGKGGDSFSEDDSPLVKVSFRLKVGEHGELIDSNIMQLLPLSFAKKMIDKLVGGTEEEVAAAAPAIEMPSAPASAPSASPAAPAPAAAQPEPSYAPPAAPQPAYEQPPMGYAPPPMYGQPMGYPGQPVYPDAYAQHAMPPGYAPYPPAYPPPPVAPTPQHFGGPAASQANVKPAQFSPLGGAHLGAGEEQNLNLLLDIPLQVTVELGRTKKLIREILDLSAGSIIQLDKLAGEHVDILVNNKLIAKGEVVVIDENFGVRVTDIISQFDRVQKLQ
jgi:flagellar motor switch protein FliN/FliY